MYDIYLFYPDTKIIYFAQYCPKPVQHGQWAQFDGGIDILSGDDLGPKFSYTLFRRRWCWGAKNANIIFYLNLSIKNPKLHNTFKD